MWNFAIDKSYQNKGLGTKSLFSLISFMRNKYHAKVITTTYNYENILAKNLYEKIGFIETDRVFNETVNEVNMKIKL